MSYPVSTAFRLGRHSSDRRGRWPVLGLLVFTLGWVGLLEGANPLLLGHPAQAQVLRPEVKGPFLADPLLDDPRDPLLPTFVVYRPLSPLERLALGQDLNQLALGAEALAEADSLESAKEQWMREVRLRRLLGLDPELAALSRVAQRMRDMGSTQELQLLSARLDQIYPTLDLSQGADRERLGAIATLYLTLGHGETAATLHRALAEAARDRGDAHQHRTHLEAMAQIQADWFDFSAAAATYGELVALVQGQGGEDDLRFLVKQIENLEFAQAFAPALAAQQQLLSRYQADASHWPQVAALQYAMAHNAQRMGDLNQASRQYQVAYRNAIAGQQLDQAAHILQALTDLYRQLEQWPDVDYLYQQRLAVERQALDAYGLMDAFDRIGQLYEQAENPDAALHAYQEGLALAHQLNYRQDYFAAQIQRLSGDPWTDASANPSPQPSQRLTPEP